MRDHNPGLVCLQETKLGTRIFNPGLNYEIYNSPPPPGDHSHGGAAVIVNKSLQHSPITLDSNLQAVAISVILEKSVTICSLYLPPRCRFRKNDILDLIKQLPTPFFILGDFNCHNPLWGGSVLDEGGKIIDDVITTDDLSLFNDGTMTFHNIYSGTFSAIDLSICSSSIFVDYTWSVNEFLNGSDHYPIHLKYVRHTPTIAYPNWKSREADWPKYERGIHLRDFDSFVSHLDAYEHFTDEILVNARNSIPVSTGPPGRPPVPWWNKTCSNLRKITRKCYRRYKATGSSTSKKIYQRNLAKQRRYYRKAKRTSWLYYINGISSKTPSSVVWKKIRKLSGKYVPHPTPSLKINDILITDPEEVANKLGHHFAQISGAKNYLPTFQKIRNNQVHLNFDLKDKEAYNEAFSLEELKDALSSTKPTSPGEDRILYEMLKHLPEDAKEFLLKIINKIWDTGILPMSWKIAIIVPVVKPRKDPTDPSSYRPIALTSCVCKLMEKMINTRLVWYLESKNLLSSFQFGFRKNRSTVDPLLRLANDIQQGFANRCQTIGVFFDLQKAYDTTWRHGIIKELFKMGIKGNMIRFINSFLSDRFIKVRIGNKISSPFVQEEGVPQGSVLSVTCFAVAINNITKVIQAPVRCSLFVDDLAIYVTKYDSADACRLLQKNIDAITGWADERGFMFSGSKTVAVQFTRSRKKDIPSTLKLKNAILPYEKEVKFLGMIFDSKLNWASHIDMLRIKVKKSLNILKVVSSYNWGADRKSLLKLYDSLCQSKLDYGCQIYSSACKTKLNELNILHNIGLRICSGAFRTTPVESIYVDTDHLPLDLRRQELGLRYIMKLKSDVKNNPAANILTQCNVNKYGTRNSSKPFQIRILEEVHDKSIIEQKIYPVGFGNFPPWLIPEPYICQKFINKKDMNADVCLAKFLEHDELHKNTIKLFTDASKSVHGVACAIVSKHVIRSGRIADNASVYTAELTAIEKAMEEIYFMKGNNFTVYSDSYSSLLAIQQRSSNNPVLLKIRELLFSIAFKSKTVNFCWVPAHVGICGNEAADREAKQAVSSDIVYYKKVPHCDMKPVIRNYIKKSWQERWASPLLPNNRKYKKIRPDIKSYWSSSNNTIRGFETRLSRLRMGHTYLTHNFILKGQNPPVCDHCQAVVTVEHVLVDCQFYHRARRKFKLENKSIVEILNDETNVLNIMMFLKEINLFKLI